MVQQKELRELVTKVLGDFEEQAGKGEATQRLAWFMSITVLSDADRVLILKEGKLRTHFVSYLICTCEYHHPHLKKVEAWSS